MIANEAREHFRKSFKHEPTLVVSAAGRVNLIGEHVDYNGGEALPIAIQRRTAVAISVREHERRTRINSGGTGGVLSLDRQKLSRKKRWTDYPAGVLQQMLRGGMELPGFEVAVASDVPSGSGLSSSAALEVAFGFAVRTLLGLPTDLVELALTCQRAEREFVGVPCGAMDQLSAACGREGHALHMRFDPATVRAVPFTDTVLIIDSAVPRSLRQSAYSERVAECQAALAALQQVAPEVQSLSAASMAQLDAAAMPDVPRRRAKHVIAECERVRRTVETLATGARFPGDLAIASHESLRGDYECSSPELDWIVEYALKAPGVAGARLTGAGWGGCAVIFGAPDALAALREPLVHDYTASVGHAARGWLVTADDGARIEA